MTSIDGGIRDHLDGLIAIAHRIRFDERSRGLAAFRRAYAEALGTSPRRDRLPPDLLSLPYNDPFRVEVGFGVYLQAAHDLLNPRELRLDDGLSLFEGLVQTYRDDAHRFVGRIAHYHVEQRELLTRVGLGYLISGELRRAIAFSIPAFVQYRDPRSAWIASVAGRGLMEDNGPEIARIENRIDHVAAASRYFRRHPMIRAARNALRDEGWAAQRLECTEAVYPVRYIRGEGIVVGGRAAATREWHRRGAGKRAHPEFRVLDWMLRDRGREWTRNTAGPVSGLASNERRVAISNLLSRLPDNYAVMLPLPTDPRRRLPRIRDLVPRVPTELPPAETPWS